MTRNRRLTTSPYEHQRGPNGRLLCRWCGTEVPKGRRTFCSDACVHEWRLRSDPGYLRPHVFKRDRGVCAQCGTDTQAETNKLHNLKWPGYGLPRNSPEWKEYAAKRRALIDRSEWEAHHIIPVVEGGGECDLANLQTLCRACHKDETAALAKRRAQAGKEVATLNA